MAEAMECATLNFSEDEDEDQVDYSNLIFHEKLGEGGEGTVSRVTFKKPFKGHKEAAAKYVQEVPKVEVEVMQKLKHPNIVSLLGSYTFGPIHIIFLEYAPNGSLHDYLKDHSKPVTEQLTWKWLTESADAIEYLHSQRLLHRDIKAPNCLLFEDNNLKLSDFGLAREINRSQTTSKQKGTDRYMAPEIHVGNEQGRGVYSKASDIYAYGMLILEIVTRQPPFEGMEWFTVIYKVGHGKRPKIPPNCSLLLTKIIQGCWHQDPKKRPTIEVIKQGKIS